jgi:hypothetical protein
MKTDDAKCFRERVKCEDELLNSRIGNILSANALLATAACISFFSKPLRVGAVIAVVAIAIDAFWYMCSVDAYIFICGLMREVRESKDELADEELRQNIQSHIWWRIPSSYCYGVILPSLLLTGWVMGVLLLVLDGYLLFAVIAVASLLMFLMACPVCLRRKILTLSMKQQSTELSTERTEVDV